MLLSWLLRLVLLLVVLRLAWRFLSGLVEGVAGPRAQGSAGPGRDAVALVKDPVCGTYVVRDKALAARSGSDTVWFCSDRCRDQWRASHTGSISP
jgi:YHS domain-containing protein